MDQVHDTIAWYQQKIGSYDKQLWEQSVEQKVLHGIRHAPRRSVRPKTELIDVDLVRGSTFTKAKPQVPWTYITMKTFSRVLLFPCHYKWWLSQLSFWVWTLMLVLYTLQVFTTFVFFSNVGDNITQDEQSLSEVVIPCLLMMLLGLIHSQTILTHFSLKPPVRDSKRDGWKRKRLISQHHGSGGSTDGVVVTSSNNDHTGLGQSNPKSKGQHSSRLHAHTGKRPVRDRHRDRKIRLKTNVGNNPPAARRSNAVSTQDSESAYHTHEASDSVQDKTSSHEHDSPELDRSGINAHHAKPSSVAAHLVEQRKTCESMESDIPESQASDSENDKRVQRRNKNHLKDPSLKVKRDSHSISSDVEVVDESPPNVDACVNTNSKLSALPDITKENKSAGKLNTKAAFEGKSVSNSSPIIVNRDINATVVSETNSATSKSVTDSSPQHVPKVDCNVEVFSDSSCVNVCVHSALPDDIPNDKEVVTSAVSVEINARHSNTTTESSEPTTSTQHSTQHHSDKTAVKAHNATSVHFTADKELVRLREITPLGSREGTPTHTQSDIMLQSQRSRPRRSTITTKSESDTESDNDKSYKSLPNVRRRKAQQDLNEGTGCVLRNRRQSFQTFRKKNDTVSSSDGGTEPQAAEYGGHKSAVSSEEWEDHIQSDVDTSSCTSSCGSEPELSGNDEPEHASEDESKGNPINLQGMTASNHVINLLQPSASQTTIHGTPDKVTCIIWEGNECKKVELTAMDIGWAIIDKVDKIPESSDYILIGFAFSVLMGLTPLLFRAFYSLELPNLYGWDGLLDLWKLLLHNPWRLNLIMTNAVVQRCFLSIVFFFLLSVADRTFKQRLLYAKHFCYLTSSRRARKFDMPHFRLNKVRNIKIWLSLRSYLKKRGPQRSVDVIVSSSFLMTLIMLIFMCLQLLRDAEIYLNYLCNWELLVWCLALGVYLLRFMTLGLRINKKYRNLSVLITEQINLYLQMEQKPHKKEELMVANNVLKLAESLLKELESPFKISGISANPFVLNVTKVVVLSAFSAVLTELLGFKLKLYKIKLKA